MWKNSNQLYSGVLLVTIYDNFKYNITYINFEKKGGNCRVGSLKVELGNNHAGRCILFFPGRSDYAYPPLFKGALHLFISDTKQVQQYMFYHVLFIFTCFIRVKLLEVIQ